MPVDPADPPPVAPAPGVAESWDDVFGLLHRVWGDSKCGQYSKRDWGLLHAVLVERASAAGWVPRCVRESASPLDSRLDLEAGV